MKANSPAPLTEIEAMLTGYQRETKRVTVAQHAAFQEECRDRLAEIGRIEREADLLTQLNKSKS